ncbi:hypothetical protein LCI18_003420 [Fusarium solani-melongenae]|uniref:Uncharacterized protein n=1 Tax=Fusarium solani subsp. cucurbitae TaxID=2747967 RepID=A0ACD3YUB6_FUSSC|nr:hypothetical protein LCI18_003420 [Fusarium solani-melongenae]
MNPNIKVQEGDLGDYDILEKQASIASIVISKSPLSRYGDSTLTQDPPPDCGPDLFHNNSISALLRGLSSQTNRSVFYIGTTGAARVWDESGALNSRVWDDVNDIDEILSLATTHAETDTLVLSSNTANLRTALISPGYVIGVSPSKSHPLPSSYPDLFRVLRQLGTGFFIGEGNARISLVETGLLAALYVRLVGDALQRISRADVQDNNTSAWGPQAYYFAANTEYSIRDFIQIAFQAMRAQGGSVLTISDEMKSVSREEVVKLVEERINDSPYADVWADFIAKMYSVNMRVKGTRAEKMLGFKWEGNDGVAESVRSYLNTNFSGGDI